ncbi:hypothetical protein C0966_02555 [Bacillus methanolicus]|nr:hypothetical protein [Bacillus methanolicus]
MAITIAQLSKVPIIPAAYIGPNNLMELFFRKIACLIFGGRIHITTTDKEEMTVEFGSSSTYGAILFLCSKTNNKNFHWQDVHLYPIIVIKWFSLF